MRLPSLIDRKVLITGATNGIGFEAAIQLAAAGADVTIVGRDPGRASAAVDTVRARSGSRRVEALLCDLALQTSIRQLAADYRARSERLDVLVNNAGAVHLEREVTPDGVERTFAVNHLAYYLLTRLLLDPLRAAAGARVVNVASRAHYIGRLDFADLGFERGYDPMRAYRRSKLCNVLFTRELARRLGGAGPTVNAVHPGGVATNIWAVVPRWATPALTLARRFMRTSAEGAERITYLAASPEMEGRTGLYIHEDMRPKTPSATARNDEVARRLWAESARLVGMPEGV